MVPGSVGFTIASGNSSWTNLLAAASALRHWCTGERRAHVRERFVVALDRGLECQVEARSVLRLEVLRATDTPQLTCDHDADSLAKCIYTTRSSEFRVVNE